MRALRGIPKVVWLLGVASLFNDVSSEAIFPLLPLFLGSLGGGVRYLGLVEGTADAIAAATKVIAGRISDRGPRGLLVVGGYAVPAVARAGIAAALAPWHVLAARVADRIGKGVRSGPRDALLAESAAAGEIGRAFGLQRSMDHLGAAVGPLLASALVAAGGSIRVTFAIAAAAGMAAPLLLLARLREPSRAGLSAGSEPPHPSLSPGLRRGRGDTAGATAIETPTSTSTPTPTTVALPSRLRAYIAVAAVFAFSNSTDAFLLLRAREVGVSAAAVPLLWFLHHVVKALVGLPGGALSDRIPRGAVVAAGWGAYALAYAGFAFAGTPGQVTALFAFYALYHGLAEGAERALVSDLAPPGLRGRAFGWYHGVVGAAALPAGVLTGSLWEWRGAAVALGTCASIAALAAVLLVASPLVRREAASRATS
jgi:MFS family permease